VTSLSVVIPVFNEAKHLSATIDSLVESVERSGFDADVVVVDDGSTDGSSDVAVEALAGRLPSRVVSQPNGGRFHAVRNGLGAARGDYVLVLGARVRLRRDALLFVRQRQKEGELVWTGHVHIHVARNPYGTFQNVLTEIAWREYFDDPRPVAFGAEEFDRYPKGSGCFVAPREVLLEAFRAPPSRYADIRHANDDTPMLRSIAVRQPIHVAPGFASDYEPRGSLRTFVKHSLHRGTVFFDGHGRRESRFFAFAVAAFPLTAATTALCFSRPRLAPVAALATSATAGAVARSAGRSRNEVAIVSALAPVWATAFAVGLWRGLAMHAVSRARSRGGSIVLERYEWT
jgi:Glycosyl transferase family 2